MSSSRKNILVVSERTPVYEEGSGDQKIIYTTYFNKKNVLFFGVKENLRVDGNLAVINYGDGHTRLVNDKKWRYADFLASFSMNQERFKKSEYYLLQISAQLNNIIDEKEIDLIVFEQTGILMWSWYRHFSSKVKCVLRVHDSHYHYLLSDIKNRKKLMSKISLLGSAYYQKKYERRYISDWVQVQFLSKHEYEYYCREYPDLVDHLVYTPPSIFVSSNEYALYPIKDTDTLFVGTMSWKPNADAVKWFLEKVLPLIRVKIPDVKLKVIGKEADNKIKDHYDNVEVVGFVKSIDDEFRTAKLFINPSRSGGGVKVKLMHASAFGLPVVTTSEGISGFQKDIQETLFVRDQPGDFANAVVELLNNEKLREEYSQRIYKYANSKFSIVRNQQIWDNLVGKLI